MTFSENKITHSNLIFPLLQLPEVEPAPSLIQNPTQQSFGRPQPSNHLSSRRSLGLRLHTEPTFIHEPAAISEPRHSTVAADTHHPSVLADRSVRLPATDQESVFRTSMVQPRSAQQANLSLHRSACFSADVLCQEDGVQPCSSGDALPQEHNNTLQ